VVHPGGVARRAFEQDELERRLGDGEVGVAGTALGGLGAEQLRVEGEGGETCVCDLLEAFEVTAPSVSYHLKILREAGLISSERRGTWVYYRVNPEVMEWMSAVLAAPRLLQPAR
jgi:DNA-binding transcriptional ArsR family regulator